MRLFPRFAGILLARIPFSLGLTAAILSVTAVTGTLTHPISPEQLRYWGYGGYSPAPLHLLLATFQILRPYMALSLIPTILVFVGGCEWRLGTRLTILVYLVGHVVGYVGDAVILHGLAKEGNAWAQALAPQLDVGGSNGAMAALGALLVFLPRTTRRLGIAGVALYLLLSFAGEAHVWDVSHLISFVTGIVVGALLYRQEASEWPGLARDLHFDRIERRRVVAWIAMSIGLVDVLTPFVLPEHPGFARVAALIPIDNPHWPRHLLFTLGATLLFLAPALGRGRRSAWWISLLLLAISTSLQWQAGAPGVEHVLSVLLIAALVMWRREFRAPGDPQSVRAGVRALVGSALLLVAYTAIGFVMLRQRFVPPFDVTAAAHETLGRLMFAPDIRTTWHSPAARWFLASIPLVGWGGLAVAFLRLTRGALAPKPTAEDEQRARGILERHGLAGTSYMTLWPGNALFFHDECYLAYRVNDHTAVVLGDPVGPADRLRATAAAFVTFAESHGWNPVFFSATEARRPVYEALGLKLVQIGEDAVITLNGLEFRGKQWQDVRTAFNRAQRDGVHFELVAGGSVPASYRAQLDEIGREWMEGRELPEIGFTLGKTGDVDDPDVEVALAIGSDGVVQAFATWLPVYAGNGWTIDLMRRREERMPGVMEFLIASSLLTFRDRGYSEATLGVAPLADLDRDEDAPLLPRVLGRVYEGSDAFYNFKSLFAFKSKFAPRWTPVYLVQRDLASVPAVTAAILKAYIPTLDAAATARLLGEVLERRLRGD
ncbi:MAG TPA: phosphatidylglycerol lysyltransferase domain-containing protein [Candidatus Krumholzibacteria bacterium]|nr:phosphatidylglycerol lysyltransferase domain-containing protein [Candidatus Krumholzibacteria bacterium]